MSWQEWKDDLDTPARHLAVGSLWVVGFGVLHRFIDYNLPAGGRLTAFVTFVDETVIAGAFVFLAGAAFITLGKRLIKLYNASSILVALAL